MNLDFESNKIGYEKNGIILTNGEIKLLESYGIDYLKYTNKNDLFRDLESCIDEYEDLENILINVDERNYYRNVNK